MIKVTLITTEGCAHCQEAKAIFDKIKSNYDVSIKEVDAASEKGQELIDEHGILASPGIIINNSLFSTGRVTEEKLTSKLDTLKR